VKTRQRARRIDDGNGRQRRYPDCRLCAIHRKLCSSQAPHKTQSDRMGEQSTVVW
jgi:hypothetical protein